MTRHKRKKKKVKGKRKGSGTDRPPEEMHAFVPAVGPKDKFLELLQYHFKKEFRNSPLWDEMVDKYGREKAEELLGEIRFDAK